MTSRAPQIHPSALSPQEYDAYSTILSDLTKNFQDSECEVKQVWDYLKTWLDGVDTNGRESEFLAFFRNVPNSSLVPLYTLLALLRLVAHSRSNSLLTRDHLFVQTEPLSLSKPPSSAPKSNNPFLSSDWASRRSSLLTPPSSLPSPTSPLSPVSAASKTKSPVNTQINLPSQAFALSDPPPPKTSEASPTPPDVPSRRPGWIPPPRRPSNNSNTPTQRSVSASIPSSSKSTILASPTEAPPPLPIRRSVSLHHPAPSATATTQLNRASTVKVNRPPPPLPPSKATKPTPTPRASWTNAHIGPEDTLNLRRSSGSFVESDSTTPAAGGGGTNSGNRSRKSSLSLMAPGIAGTTGGGGRKNRSRSSSSASTKTPSKAAASEYTYSPIASSSTISSSSLPQSSQQHPSTKSNFEGFSNGSIVLPPTRSVPPPPPSHPNRRQSIQPQISSATSSPSHRTTTSPSTNRSSLGLDPFASPTKPLSKHHSTSPSSASTILGAGTRVREVIESMGGTKSRKRSNGETDFERREERDGLICIEDNYKDDPESEEDEGEEGYPAESRETESSETEDEGIITKDDEKRERRKEVDREARRRDEQGQWIQLA